MSMALANRGELVDPRVVFAPLAIAVWFTLVAWAVARLRVRNPHKRALIALMWTIWFAGFGLFIAALAQVRVRSLTDARIALPLWTLFAIGATRAITKAQRPLKPISQIANTGAVILVLLLPLSLIGGVHTSARDWQPGPMPETHMADTPQALPDIYYVVLDAYSGERSLRTEYGFDNRFFEDSLRALGFFVPRAARSNYASTFLALAAALNWEYLDTLHRIPPDAHDRTLAYRMIEDSRTARLLRSLGYRIIFFPTPYGATARNRLADQVIPPAPRTPPRLGTEFGVVWLNTTPVPATVQIWCAIAACNSGTMPFRPESPDFMLWKFRALAELRQQPGPKFVLAHLLVPHEPYMFSPTCGTKPLRWQPAVDGEDDRRMRGEYVEQVQCVNRQVLLLVSQLLADPGRTPIIMLQADHGNARFPFGRPPPIDQISRAQLQERTDVFAAYRIPGDMHAFSDTIGPVNAVRLMLRTQFGVALPQLEERTYYSPWKDPYRFTRVR
jgi:hypothetical protein